MTVDAEPAFELRVALKPSEVEEVVETPTSSVLLTKDHAYKVRKEICWPPYLDYSTPSRRRRAAAREIDRGRPFSAGLYLGLAELTWTGGDEPEAAVAMRRLGRNYQTGLDGLRELGQGDRFVAPLLRAAHTLHSRTRRYDRLPDGALDLGQRFRILFEECASLGFANGAPRRLAKQFVQRYRGSGRARSGCLRELHGDFHAGNILTDGRRCVPFDFSDFSDKFLVGDVAIDYGFLCADLMGTGHLDLGDPRLDRFVEASRTPFDVLVPMTVYGSLNRAAVFASDTRTSGFAAVYAALAERLSAAWLRGHRAIRAPGRDHGTS